MNVERIFISPEHNFFGHQGQPAGLAPILEVEEVECVAGRGIRGDRFFDYKPDYKGQITFFSLEVYAEMCFELGLREDRLSALRRNVVVSGEDLGLLIGREFGVQGLRFLGTEESRPCHWMNTAVAGGAEEWLRGRAGLRAKILTGGILRKGTG